MQAQPCFGDAWCAWRRTCRALRGWPGCVLLARALAAQCKAQPPCCRQWHDGAGARTAALCVQSCAWPEQLYVPRGPGALLLSVPCLLLVVLSGYGASC